MFVISSVCFVSHLTMLHMITKKNLFCVMLSVTTHDVVTVHQKLNDERDESRKARRLVGIIFQFLLGSAAIRKEMRELIKDVCILKAWRLELLTGVLETKIHFLAQEMK